MHEIKNTIKKLDLQALLSKEKKSVVKVANWFILTHSKYDHIYFSHDRIGEAIGIKSRKTVWAAIQRLQEVGFLSYLYQHRKSSWYKINPDVYKHWHVLKNKFYALKNSSRVVQFIMTISMLLTNYTAYNKQEDIYKYNPCISVSHSLARARDLQPKLTGIFVKNIEKPKNGRVWMDANGDLIRSGTLQAISRALRLTKLGECKLMVFPDKVLGAVWPTVNATARQSDTAFNYLFVACKNYCAQNRIFIEYEGYKTIAKYYNLEVSGPMQEESSKGVSIKSTAITMPPAYKGPTDEELRAKYGSKPALGFAMPDWLKTDTIV